MRSCYLIYPLLLFPLSLFSQTTPDLKTIVLAQDKEPQNTLVRSLSSEEDFDYLHTSERKTHFPTQIIRLSTALDNQNIDCTKVNEDIDAVLINKITRDKFTYSIYISCTYDPQTKYATRVTINSYFDPLNDDAIDYLKGYLNEYNGVSFLGTTLNIESARSLIVSLNLSVGLKKNPNTPPFIQYREDRSNFYFKSNYEMTTQLIADINERFFSDDPDKILPFLDKWLFNYAGTVYKSVLRDSNFVLLQPERIFLMNSGEEIFVSRIKYHFAHNCSKYEHQHCLKQDSASPSTIAETASMNH